MPTLLASGTQAATLDTEHFLSSPAVAGNFTLTIDTNAMVAGDVLVVRQYVIVLTGGTARLYAEDSIIGVQDKPIWKTAPLDNDLVETNAIRYSIEQTDGTGRSFPWKVIQL